DRRQGAKRGQIGTGGECANRSGEEQDRRYSDPLDLCGGEDPARLTQPRKIVSHGDVFRFGPWDLPGGVYRDDCDRVGCAVRDILHTSALEQLCACLAVRDGDSRTTGWEDRFLADERRVVSDRPALVSVLRIAIGRGHLVDQRAVLGAVPGLRE